MIINTPIVKSSAFRLPSINNRINRASKQKDYFNDKGTPINAGEQTFILRNYIHSIPTLKRDDSRISNYYKNTTQG